MLHRIDNNRNGCNPASENRIDSRNGQYNIDMHDNLRYTVINSL